MSLVSVSILMEKHKIIGSVARRLIRHFEAAGKIKQYAKGTSSWYHYTGVDFNRKDAAAAAEAAANTKGKKK